MKKMSFFAVFLFISAFSLAQESSFVHGIVFNTKNEPLPGAVITCISLPDSTAFSYAVSGDDGCFRIKVPRSVSVVEVSYIGYEKQLSEVTSSEIKICLKESENFIGDVTVKAKTTVEKKAGKLVFSPEASDFVKGLDSYEMLKYTPLISVQDNVIKLIGDRNVTIYINGRKPVMGQAAVLDMLRSTPAENIKRIEVITAPTSAYKASMSGGVLNIIIVSPNDGFSGSATAALEYSYERFSPNASVYMAYSKNKFRTSATLWGWNRNSLTKITSEYDYKTTGVQVKSSEAHKRSYAGGGGNINLEYDINDKNNIGGSVTLSGMDYWTDGEVMSDYLNYGVEDYFLKTISKGRSPKVKPDIGATVYYRLKTDDIGSNLDISGSYNRSYSNTVNSMEYLKKFPGKEFERYEMFRQIPTQNIDGYEFNAAYSHYFKDESLLQAGIEINFTNIDNDFVRENWNGTEYINDAAQSNLFLYDELVSAVFLNYEREWSDVFSSTIGLRGEHTYIKGDQRTAEESFERSYFNVFPQLSLNFDFDEGNHNLSLDLGKSIFRPFYSDLNPFRVWTSPNTYIQGNKNLQPSLDYYADIMYILKRDYYFGTYYIYSKNTFSEYIGTGDGNTTVTTVENYGNSHSLTLFSEVRKNFFNKIWQSKLSLYCYYDIAKGIINDTDVSYNNWYGSLSWYNIIRLSEKRQVDLTFRYYYSTPIKSITSYSSNHKHLIHVSLIKRFKFGGTLSLSAYNLLNYRARTNYDADTYFYKINTLSNGISFHISYSQSFGNYRVRGAKNSTSRKLESRMSKND